MSPTATPLSDFEKQQKLVEKKLNLLLSREDVKKHPYEKATLYLVNEEVLREILLLESSVRGLVEDKKENPFDHYAKIINPEQPAYKYTHTVKQKYKNFSAEEKVRKAIPERLSIWINTSRKRLRDQIEEGDYSQKEITQFWSKLEQDISLTEHNVELLLKDFGKYHVVITNYEDGHTYSNLYFTLQDGSSINEHLRTTVPNILWYDEDAVRAKRRSNFKIGEIVENYTSLCGQIYFKKIEKEENAKLL